MFNNETFTIKKIDQTTGNILVGDATRVLDVPINDFQKMFYVAYCITIHKSHGETYTYKYSIREFDKGKTVTLD